MDIAAVVDLVRASMMPSVLLTASSDVFDLPPLAANDSMADLLGAPVDRLESIPLRDSLVDPPTDDELVELAAVVAGEREHVQLSLQLLGDGRGTVPVELLVSRFVADDGPLLLVQCLDMTERNAALRALADAEERLGLTLEHAPIPMAVVSVEGVVEQANAALCEFFARTREDLLGRTVAELTHPDDLAEDLGLMDDLLARRRHHYQMDKRFLLPDGTVVWGRLTVGLAVSSDGRPLHFVAQLVDVTLERRREQELLDRSLRDPLTELPNRRALLATWARLRGEQAREGDPHHVGVLFCDLDHFKAANDAGGHVVGDELLRQVARRVVATIRPGDLFSRIGGDEFVVLCRVRSADDALALARRIQAGFEDPFHVGDVDYRLAVSIGVSLGTPDDEPDDLLADADAAMFRAKRSGTHVELAGA